MDRDVFDEVDSMVQMEGAKEIEVAQEIPKEGNAQSCIVVPKMEEKLPHKVCYEMPTKKMSSHLKSLYVGAQFDGVPVSEVLIKRLNELIPTETTVSGFVGQKEEKKATVEESLRRLYDFGAERAAEHRSTANLVEFLHEGPEDDALEPEEVELAPSKMEDSKAKVQDPLVEINLGTEDNHQSIYIRSNGARTLGQDGRAFKRVQGLLRLGTH
ncbi:unnamed protein product [Prunus armeniaca]